MMFLESPIGVGLVLDQSNKTNTYIQLFLFIYWKFQITMYAVMLSVYEKLYHSVINHSPNY